MILFVLDIDKNVIICLIDEMISFVFDINKMKLFLASYRTRYIYYRMRSEDMGDNKWIYYHILWLPWNGYYRPSRPIVSAYK